MRVHNNETISLSDVQFLLHYYLSPSSEDTDCTLFAKSFISSLPDREKIAYVLTLDGHTVRAIGAFLSIPKSTISRVANKVQAQVVKACREFDSSFYSD